MHSYPHDTSITMPVKTFLLPLLLCVATHLAVRADGTPGVQFRSNLLYDAMLIPNLGVDMTIANRYEAGLDVKGAWWSDTRHHRSWRIFGIEATGRRYLGRQTERFPSGHHLGLYFQVTSYDFKLGKTGYIGGTSSRRVFDRPTLGVGIEYGYTRPIGARMALDFAIGFGWAGGHCQEYTDMDGHDVWLRTLRRSWWGPTRAAISLIYRLNR